MKSYRPLSLSSVFFMLGSICGAESESAKLNDVIVEPLLSQYGMKVGILYQREVWRRFAARCKFEHNKHSDGWSSDDLSIGIRSPMFHDFYIPLEAGRYLSDKWDNSYSHNYVYTGIGFYPAFSARFSFMVELGRTFAKEQKGTYYNGDEIIISRPTYTFFTGIGIKF